MYLDIDIDIDITECLWHHDRQLSSMFAAQYMLYNQKYKNSCHKVCSIMSYRDKSDAGNVAMLVEQLHFGFTSRDAMIVVGDYPVSVRCRCVIIIDN